MKRFKKLALTVGVLAALAVGGAAFAQAQNAAVATQVPTHKSITESTSSTDTDNVQSGDQGGSDRGGAGEAEDSAAENAQGKPETAAESDGPGGHHDEPGNPNANTESGADD